MIRRYISVNVLSRSTENDAFVQSITNDDVLTNNIRRELNRAYVTPSTHLVQEKNGKSSVVCIVFQEAVYRPPTAIC